MNATGIGLRQPVLTKREVARPWMKVKTACMATLGDVTAKDIRNWSDRRLIDFKQSDDGEQRLYSLCNLLQIAAIHHFSTSGYSLELAALFGDTAMHRLVSKIGKEIDVTTESKEQFLVYTVTHERRETARTKGYSVETRYLSAEEIASDLAEKGRIGAFVGPNKERRLFPMDEMIRRQVERYLGELETFRQINGDSTDD